MFDGWILFRIIWSVFDPTRHKWTFVLFFPDRSFLVANAQQAGCNIIYCSDGFCHMTGYSRAEVMQCPAICEFLQGPMTSQHAVSVVKEALAAGIERHFEILYYRKDGKWHCFYYGFRPFHSRGSEGRLTDSNATPALSGFDIVKTTTESLHDFQLIRLFTRKTVIIKYLRPFESYYKTGTHRPRSACTVHFLPTVRFVLRD